mmetsp:Transcript_32457/g.72142  ORF Transcript_32457/g.72142 Transcript_32457/m.72142 type:complete len:497 (-) Transcript_32457:62-1552(-)
MEAFIQVSQADRPHGAQWQALPLCRTAGWSVRDTPQGVAADPSRTLVSAVAGLMCLRNVRKIAITRRKASEAAPAQRPRRVAKETLARLRKRAPKVAGSVPARRMPPKPDPLSVDSEGRQIFPWPKSFAEIVQTAVESSMRLFVQGETRVEVDFPPLPLADLDWNLCDLSETRVVDSNVQHAIAFSKLLIKDSRQFPKLDPEVVAKKNRGEGVDVLEEKLKSQSTRQSARGPGGRTVRMLFPNKVDMVRAREVHLEKFKNMARPDLLRRGFYREATQDNWKGPLEDIYVFIVCQEAVDLPIIQQYVEKADRIAAKQGRVLRHVLFNLNLNKLRTDIEFYRTVTPFRPGLATPEVHFDFLATFRPAYFIRFLKSTLTVLRNPFNIDYSGALYRAFPGPWQVFMQDVDGSYNTVDVHDKRPAIIAFKRKLLRAFGLAEDARLPKDPMTDDVYTPKDPKAFGSISRPFDTFLREGGEAEGYWWEGGEAFKKEVSEKWRV